MKELERLLVSLEVEESESEESTEKESLGELKD
jgi:hypothetical protein